MKPLRKSDRKRFEETCRVIREHLHLEHWRCEGYHFEKSHAKSTAESGIWEKNSRVSITIYDDFWDDSFDKQIRVLIHEHVHCVLARYDHLKFQVVEACSPTSKWAFEKWFDHVSEHVTDHLEAVLFDLLRPRLCPN